nr:restriction endonuclease subunit S [uncultured Methanolobus sp.]
MKLPDGWGKERLSNISIIQTGIAKNQNTIENSIELPYLRVANVQDGFFDLNEIKTIRIPHEKVKRYRLVSGDVLLTEGGDFDKLGRGAVWYEQIKDCVHQNHIFVVRPNKKHIISEFLSAQTGSTYGKKYFISCSKQSTNLASINSTQLKAFPVILPPLPEQKAIADLLSTWDEAIEKTERLIRAKEKQFKWLLDYLIFKPCHERKWKEVRLNKLFESMTQKNAVAETNVLTTSAEHGLVSQLKYYKKSVSAKDVSGYYLLKKGDFAYNRSSSNGYPYGVIKRLDESDQGVLSTLYISMRPISGQEMNSDFYVYLFESGILNRKLRGICQEGARSHGLLNLSKSDYFAMKIPYPTIETQNEVAEILNLAGNEIELIRSTLEKYKTQKRVLMQKMLTGEWRVMSDVVKSYEEKHETPKCPREVALSECRI